MFARYCSLLQVEMCVCQGEGSKWPHWHPFHLIRTPEPRVDSTEKSLCGSVEGKNCPLVQS